MLNKVTTNLTDQALHEIIPADLQDETSAAGAVMRPWEASPYGIVSWWDMEQFSARAYYLVGKLMERVRLDYWFARRPGDSAFSGSALDDVIQPASADGLADFMAQIAEHCLAIGLEMPAKQSAYIRDSVPRMTNRQAAEGIDCLDRLIRWAMENHLFFSISPGEAQLYKQDEPPFGQEVQNSFPSASFDVAEAGKCLALGRGTACVMHLGRAVECGLKVLASELKLPPRNDWGKHLTDIEAELTARYKAAGARTPDELFFAEAAAQIGHIKHAWRNPTMHVDRTYTEDEAKGILQAVRSFMQQLATKLHE
jgi:hypothetical protein